MSAKRTLPIENAHREFIVKTDGKVVSRREHLLSVTIIKTANRVSVARLCYLDGDAAASEFPLSNSSTFVPGQTVEILAGSSSNPVLLFVGSIIKQSIKVRVHVAPQLIVECRHKAVNLTVGRHNAYFFDKTDSEIIKSLIERGGALKAEVEPTTLKHEQQVQYACTDWDFLLMRAEANSQMVFTNESAVVVRKPSVMGKPNITLHFGSTLLELDTEIDARTQVQEVRALSWDPAAQELIDKPAADPHWEGPGNFSPNTLAKAAGRERECLTHAVIAPEEAQAWADAHWLRTRLNKVRGRAKCEGIGTINPGDVVRIDGAGNRCSGNVLVLGLRHDFDLVQGWKTHLQWGDAEPGGSSAPTVNLPSASTLVAATSGLQIGLVVNNEDPHGQFRIKVRMPLISLNDEGTWARVSCLDAGAERGAWFRPEIGDEVILGFFHDDPRQPVILGMLHSTSKSAPEPGSNENHLKGYQSRSKLRLTFDDDKKSIKWATPAGNSVTLDDAGKVVVLSDQHGNEIKLSADGITLNSPKAIKINSGTELSFEGGTSVSGKASTSIKLTGSAGAELSSPAITTIKGSMVHIN